MTHIKPHHTPGAAFWRGAFGRPAYPFAIISA